MDGASLLRGLYKHYPSRVHASKSCPASRRRKLTHQLSVSRFLPLVDTYGATAQDEDKWAALGDPTRRAIFDRLAARPQAVGELARKLPVSRPAVSQHLRILKDAGLVVDSSAGTRRIYRIDPNGLAALRSQLEFFWTKALHNYKDIVERPKEEER